MRTNFIRIAVISLLVLLPLFSGGRSWAQPPGKASFQKILDQLDNAEQHKNVDLWTKLLKANSVSYFTMTVAGHQQDFDQIISGERSFNASMKKSTKDVQTITSFIQQGNVASVKAIVDQSADVVDDTGETGKPGSVNRFEVINNVSYSLILVNGSWKMQSAIFTLQSVSVNGHKQKLRSSI